MHTHNEKAKPLRQHDRVPVTLEAQIRLNQDLLVGSILDLSQGGVFFRPEAGFLKGKFTQIHNPPDHLARVDTVELQIFDRGTFINQDAKICWIGFHEAYGSQGIGMRFDEKPAGDQLFQRFATL